MKLQESDPADKFHRHIWPLRADVLRTALFLTHHRAEADDLAQETMLKAWKSIVDFVPSPRGAQPWLLTILRHCWIDRHRRTKSEQDVQSLDALGEDPPAGNGADGSPLTEVDPANFAPLLEALSDQNLIDAIKQVPPDYRWVLLLVDVHGYAYDDAAATLRIPIGTVRSRLFRGRDCLRQVIAEGKSALSGK